MPDRDSTQKKLRFVVTGAGGFLGSHVVRELLTSTGHEVVAVTSQTAHELKDVLERAPYPAMHRLPDVLPRRELLPPGSLGADDVIINCAFPWNRGGVELADGLEFLVGLFDVASKAHVHSFVNVSSQSVYSQSRTEPADEQSPIECDTPYSTAKYAMELAAGQVLSHDVLVNARMSSLIGVGYDVRIVNRFLARFLAHQDVQIQGGEQLFDFMDVRDAAKALVVLALTDPRNRPTVVNVGSNNALALKEIAHTVADVVRAETEHRPVITWSPSSGDTRTLGLNSNLLHREFGFTPQFTLADSTRHILHGMTNTRPAAEQRP